MRKPLLADVMPIHPITGVTALGIGKRGPIWPVMGASPDDDSNGDAGDGGSGDAGSQGAGSGNSGAGNTGASSGSSGAGTQDDGTYPANTPVAEMTAQQAANYWKAQARKHENRVSQMADYKDLKSKAAEFDKLAEASQTEAEKAINAARAEGREEAKQEVLRQVGAQLVHATIRGSVSDRLPAAQLDVLLENLDPSKFLTDAHEVDTDKVATYVASIAPAKKAEEQQQKTPNLGQGVRNGGQGSAVGVEAGRDLYRNRHPRRVTT